MPGGAFPELRAVAEVDGVVHGKNICRRSVPVDRDALHLRFHLKIHPDWPEILIISCK